MNSKDKIQHMLMTHLLKEGSIEIVLPQGMRLELGITRNTKHGERVCDNYCWLTASQDDKKISLDAYNLGLEFSNDRLVFGGEEEDVQILEVV